LLAAILNFYLKVNYFDYISVFGKINFFGVSSVGGLLGLLFESLDV